MDPLLVAHHDVLQAGQLPVELVAVHVEQDLGVRLLEQEADVLPASLQLLEYRLHSLRTITI